MHVIGKARTAQAPAVQILALTTGGNCSMQTRQAVSATYKPEAASRVFGQALYNKLVSLFNEPKPETSAPAVRAQAEIKNFEEIPGPRGLPMFGSALDYTPLGRYSPKKFTVALKDRHAQFGTIFREKIMDEEFIYISDPKDVSVMVRNEGKFPCRPHLEVITESREQQGLPIGVTAMQGQEWLNNRNAANPILMRPKSVRKARSGQRQVTNDFVDYMRQNRDAKTGEIDDFEFGLNKWALESVAVILLDMRLGLFEKGESKSKMVAKKLHHCMDIFFDLGARLTFSAPIWKLFETKDWKVMKQSQKDEFKYAGMIVDEKLAKLEATKQPPQCPFSSKAVNRSKAGRCPVKPSKNANSLLEHVINNESLSRSEAVTLTLEMLAGGIDTTSTCAIFMLYQLCRNKPYQEKLRQLALKSSGDDAKEAKDDFVRLLKACSFEAMRLNPLTYANARQTDQDLVLGGYKVPAGTVIRFTSHLMNLRNPDYFPEPERFIPERWLDKNSKYACKEQFAFTPFGHGARQCPGRRVAQQELDLLFRTILTNFSVDYHHGDIGTKVRLFNRSNLPPKFSFTDL